MIFVFGSNLAGRHGAGAALYAAQQRGAIYGQGEGMQGDSYAIPTCDENIRPLPLDIIRGHINIFLQLAAYREAEGVQYQVTRVGCGLAGYTDVQIAPMFFDAPDNVWLPSAWIRAATRRAPSQSFEER